MITYRHATAVTTGTTVVKYRALWIGGAGNVTVRMLVDQNTVTFNSVPAGTMLELEVDQVLSATTATNIVGLN